MAAGGHIGNVTWKQIDIESCVIPLFLLILAWRIHFWHSLCIMTSPTIKIQEGCQRPYWNCNFKVNGHITCWISHEKLVFSNMCLFPGIISCILTSRSIKIQDGHQWPYWNCSSKENSTRNRYNITFLINHCTQSPFLASFVYFDRSECQN